MNNDVLKFCKYHFWFNNIARTIKSYVYIKMMLLLYKAAYLGPLSPAHALQNIEPGMIVIICAIFVPIMPIIPFVSSKIQKEFWKKVQNSEFHIRTRTLCWICAIQCHLHHFKTYFSWHSFIFLLNFENFCFHVICAMCTFWYDWNFNLNKINNFLQWSIFTKILKKKNVCTRVEMTSICFQFWFGDLSISFILYPICRPSLNLCQLYFSKKIKLQKFSNSSSDTCDIVFSE